jgi:integrase
MSTRLFRKSWWIDFRYGGRRYRKRSPVNTKAGAEIYEAQLRNRLLMGESIDIKKPPKKIPTFEEYSKGWLATYVVNNNKISEQEKKESILRIHLNPFLGKLPFNEITTHKVELFKASKVACYNPKTINNMLAVMGKCLRCAYEEYELESKLPKIQLMKTTDPDFDYLSIEESELLLKYANGVWQDMILVALKAGLRLGELLALDWNDLNFVSKIITVRRSMYKGSPGSTKTHKVRVVSMTDDIIRVLGTKKDKAGYVFKDSSGDPIKDHTAARNIHRICKLANIRLVRWHVLRHTFASHLAMAGTPMRVIQDSLGHTTQKMTMRYAHLSPHTFENEIKKLNITNFENVFGQQVGNKKKELVKIKKRESDIISNTR